MELTLLSDIIIIFGLSVLIILIFQKLRLPAILGYLITGMEYNLLSAEIYQYFLVISFISMGATPFIINFSPAIVNFILRTPLPYPVRERLKVFTRTNFNVTVLAIKRGEQYITEVKPEEVIKQGDILYVFGRPDDIIKINKLLQLS